MRKSKLVLFLLIASLALSACGNSDKTKEQKAQEAFDAKQKEYAESSQSVKNDKTPPVISSTISEAVYDVNETIDYERLLYSLTAIDDVDGDITKRIEQKNSDVKEGVIGNYTVVYSVTDSAGNDVEFSLPVIIHDEKEDSTHRLYEGDGCTINNVKVKIKKIDSDYKVSDDEFDSYKPKDGFKYIAVTITVKNKTKKDVYISSNDFNCYADDKLQEEAYVPNQKYYSSELQAGKSVTFTLFYEVNKKAKKYEIKTTDDYWGKEPILICVDEKQETELAGNNKKDNKKTREDYTTDKNYDWYIRNGEKGDDFSFTMQVNQKIDDNTYLCDMNTDYTSDKAFILIDKNDYTKEITGGKRIIEGDTIRVYGEYVDAYTYTTAIGGTKEAIRVKAVYIDIK